MTLLPRTGLEYGTFGIRLVGFIIDAIILGVVGGLMRAMLGNTGTGIGFLIAVTYIVGMNANGGTLGKRAVGLRLESAQTGKDIGYGPASVRYIVAIFSAALLFVGYFWMIWHDNNQTWQDKAAGSVVVRT